MNNNKLQLELTVPDTELSHKYIDPTDKVSEGYKKVIHAYSTKIIPENEPIAFTPYYYNKTQINSSFNNNK